MERLPDDRSKAKVLLIFLLSGFVSLAAAQTYTISGTLRDTQTGESLDGRVCVSRAFEFPPIGCVNSQSGNYVTEPLPAGDYRIEARADGYVTVFYIDDHADGCGSPGKGEPISVGPDATGIDFEMERSLSLTGTVLAANGNSTRLAYIETLPIDINDFCAVTRYPQEGGVFTTDGEIPLAAGSYVLSAIPTGPGTPVHRLISGNSGDVIDDIVLRLGGDSKPRLPNQPPIVSLMTFSQPNDNHMITVTGAAGAAQPSSALFLINLDIGSSAVIMSDEQGAFSTELYAPVGSLIEIKQDSSLKHFAWLFQISEDPFQIKEPEGVLGGVLVYLPPSNNPLEFAQSGILGDNAEEPLPAFQVYGQVDRVNLQPGDDLNITGTVKVLTQDPGASPVSRGNPVWLERITSADGTQIIPEPRFTSTRMTPTGLPVEQSHNNRGESNFEWYEVEFAREAEGPWEGPFNIVFNIPDSLESGYYQLKMAFQGIDVALTEPRNTQWFLPAEGFRPVPLPLLKIGDPLPPKMFLHLLTNQFHRGSRGIRAQEDFDRFGLASNIASPSDVLVMPMHDPLTGIRVTYNLDPFIPQITRSARHPPHRRLPLLSLPSGALRMEIENPSGGISVLGPAPFSQLSISTPARADGRQIDLGGQHMTNVAQLRTMDPQFDVQFEEYGKHIIRVEMNVDDAWGNNWTGSGTFEVWVARPLVVDTTVFPGMSFEQGDSLHTGVVVSPAGPATVDYRYMIAPDSVQEDRQSVSVTGTANRFGQFHGDQIDLDQAGEYRVDVTASYTDEQGVLWMGSRTWGGVVARANSPIIAHGRRGIDDSPEIAPQWFTRESLGLIEGNSHVPFPFANGDIQWVNKDDSAVPQTTIQALSQDLKQVFRERLENFSGLGPGSLEERITAGVIPLLSGGIGDVEPHMSPELTDLWAYSYRTSQRPLVSVREVITEDDVAAYWRFEEQYFRQVGVGMDGDRENEIKFQYGGAVVRGDAMSQAEYAIHGSLFVLVPRQGEGGVTRTFPPFQGNGGGPSGGPIITHKGKDIDMLLNLRAMRPGSIYEIGDTFSLAGAIGPTLAGKISYTVTAPSGIDRQFSGQANSVGYYYQPSHDFELTEPGIYMVDLEVMFDGQTSAGQVTEPFPTGDILGSDNGRFYFYVVDDDNMILANQLPRESLFEPQVNHDFTHANHFIMDIELMLPDGFSPLEAHVTTMMPGTILESRKLDTSAPLTYTLDVSSLGQEVPNLDWENGLADLLTTSIYVTAEDASDKLVHWGRVINLHGAQIFNLNVHEAEKIPIFSDSFEGEGQ